MFVCNEHSSCASMTTSQKKKMNVHTHITFLYFFFFFLSSLFLLQLIEKKVLKLTFETYVVCSMLPCKKHSSLGFFTRLDEIYIQYEYFKEVEEESKNRKKQ